MKKALFSLLLLSTATLHAGKFSDAVNGLLPDDIQDSKQFQAWHSQMAQQFKERAEKALLLHDQLERLVLMPVKDQMKCGK